MADGKAGAPVGNTNAAKAKIWQQAIHRHLAKRPKDLEDAAMALFEAAKSGDVSAMKEIGDRLDGKVTQPVGGDPDAPLVSKVIYEVVGTSG